MPLRQTCDRCRELKVRCRKDQSALISGQSGSTPCIRCVRAGSNCVFNRKNIHHVSVDTSTKGFHYGTAQQPSGRPGIARSGGRSLRQGASASSQTQSSVENRGRTLGTSRLPEVESDYRWSHEAFFASLDSNLESDELLSAGIEPNEYAQLSDSVPGSEFENVLDESGSRVHQGTSDDTENSIQELMEVNLRIYRAFRSASIRGVGSSPTSEELIEMTRSLLGISERITNLLKLQCRGNHGATPESFLQDSLGFPLSGYENSANASSTVELPDTSMVFMILACSERLLDLFSLVCFPLQVQVSSLPIRERHEERMAEILPDNAEATGLSNAQIVMTVELINHLVDRLDRGQRQVVDCLRTKSPPRAPSITTPISSDVATEPTNVTAGIGVVGGSSWECSADFYAGQEIAKGMLEAMQGKRHRLHTCIRSIKSVVREKDDI